MLEYLRVRNIGVIEDVSMEFSKGFVVVTGETGAGKTLLTSALSFLLGSKLPRSTQKSETVVEAVINLKGQELHVRRELNSLGRSRSFRDGELITSAELSQLMQSHIEIFGQNLSVSLSKPQFQLQMLDRAGRISLERLIDMRSRLRQLERELEDFEERNAELTKKRDELRETLAELERARLTTPDEDGVLEEKIEVATHIEETKATLRQALSQLDPDHATGVLDELARLVRVLSRLPGATEISQRVENALIDLSDIKSELYEQLSVLEGDEASLEEMQARLFQLRTLERKYQMPLSELVMLQERCKEELSRSDSGLQSATYLDTEIQHLRSKIADEESQIRSLRVKTASAIKDELETLLADLGLSRTTIEFNLSAERDGTPMETLVSTNPGTPLAPLGHIASGGELSRIMLALCRVLGSDATTLIFDEIDAGIGGETALWVARSLKALGEQKQVVAVTHLAQVASFADQHFVVEKEQSETSTKTVVKELVTYDAQVTEISRMLSGQRDSEAAREHADELLKLGAKG